MRRTLQTGAAIVGAAMAVAAGPAVPAHAVPVSLGLPFTADRPASSTGLTLHVRYGPDDAKPPELTAAQFALPAGTQLDTSAVPACRATDEELRALARDACPPETKVGEGSLVAVTGFGAPTDPVRTDVTVFNGPGQLIEVVTFEGTNSFAGADRLTVEGSTLVAHPPTTPGGPPDGRTTIREIRFELSERRGADGRAYLTTPPSCPADGIWRGQGRFAFTDGTRATAGTAQACRAPRASTPQEPGPGSEPGDGARRPGLAMRVLTRRLVAHRRGRVRVHVRAQRATCRTGVVVRVGDERAVTDARGRATVGVTVRRARRVRVRAGKAGCGRVVGSLRVSHER